MLRLFCLLILPVFSSAQIARSFESSNLDVYKNIADLISQTAEKPYSFLLIDSSKAGLYNVEYTSANNDTLFLIIHYSKSAKNGNDLYSITHIKAPFKQLFNFWKIHFEPEAKEATLVAYEHGESYGLKEPNGHEKVFSFGKQEDNANWMIRVREY